MPRELEVYIVIAVSREILSFWRIVFVCLFFLGVGGLRVRRLNIAIIFLCFFLHFTSSFPLFFFSLFVFSFFPSVFFFHSSSFLSFFVFFNSFIFNLSLPLHFFLSLLYSSIFIFTSFPFPIFIFPRCYPLSFLSFCNFSLSFFRPFSFCLSLYHSTYLSISIYKHYWIKTPSYNLFILFVYTILYFPLFLTKCIRQCQPDFVFCH